MTFSDADRLRFIINRLRERLRVKPLGICVISMAGIFLAKAADRTGLRQIVPKVSVESVEIPLSVMASSMLVIATFAVTSMVSAYSSTSSTAPLRSFRLIIADDMSWNAFAAHTLVRHSIQ